MALMTRSQFFFGPEITDLEVYLDFSEGGPEIIAQINSNAYSPETFADEIARAMSEAGTQNYDVSFNRSTRVLVISAPGPFELLIGTGSHAGSTLWLKMGFTGVVDLTGFSTYSANSACGYSYRPQFHLLDYVSTDQRQEAVETSINISASGKREVIRFGTAYFMECNIDLINNYKQIDNSFLENDLLAIENVIFFLQNITNNGDVEFMPDRDDPTTFEVLRLESTEENKDGLGYKLKERLEYGPGYFSTGKLVFRKVVI